MDVVPTGVSICLYSGITKRIEWITKQMDWHREDSKADPKLLGRDIKYVEEALEFYAEHCVLSYAYLERDFEQVKERYNSFMAEHFPDWKEGIHEKAFD